MIGEQTVNRAHELALKTKAEAYSFIDDVKNGAKAHLIQLLGTSDSKIAKQLGFDRTDKYFYEKWVNTSELELFEEKSITM